MFYVDDGSLGQYTFAYGSIGGSATIPIGGSGGQLVINGGMTDNPYGYTSGGIPQQIPYQAAAAASNPIVWIIVLALLALLVLRR